MKAYATLDAVGISLSSLCIIHCIFLPLLGSSLPLFGILSEFEWVHKGLVVLAFSVACNLILSSNRIIVQCFATFGVGLLCAAAFLPPLHDIELPVTVLGAFLLGMAHTVRFFRLKHSY